MIILNTISNIGQYKYFKRIYNIDGYEPLTIRQLVVRGFYIIQKNQLYILTRKIIIDRINHVINIDYKLNKRIDGIEAKWVYSGFE